MGKENCFGKRIEPFALLFWAHNIVLAHILQKVNQPAGLATLNYIWYRTAVES